ncbi:hypothetical protein [Fulvimonas soli]|jgi:hypothetical protein|uniref:Uncharacterized protein n=1 Tax=Fulvimonas soli TaxID=155197 RepID=A0A316HRW7_9GAMM|nr:hypothetical protein [Fulvimonas soli]PWK82726.1 hypothetical protein C7456_11523 [Fulvimonas soli]TNY26109.1 hypothetical protein BV497_10460 [Fulvimonas soli]
MTRSVPQTYRRPPMTRACDPQRMNWLWRLVCEVAELQPGRLVEALHAAQVPVDLQRVRSWSVPDTDDAFFPMTLAEVERNLRALVALRRRNAVRPVADDAAAPAGG